MRANYANCWYVPSILAHFRDEFLMKFGGNYLHIMEIVLSKFHQKIHSESGLIKK